MDKVTVTDSKKCTYKKTRDGDQQMEGWSAITEGREIENL